ncbi:hypothetical protein GUITHDRAFT_148752 [Guillardia theta CCMP2712]|uniref:Uncharacterized protein n=1 Tax=Guillardia theta (strain CCMP2712) TaxID=905079 RepID=L1I7K4_GUITC|nr:hypothetical protein GUITHDRAFT_148752 [Guillardia theta CCMP2712]EKX32246.1 hypothetical protein GUITHDRAFT_148752 [Guillardia theta CCMP2712]|eukprot:XP_005819226.1 hypothetical protein GUITHDRAFT_148752 [Guillardia theta CCMP2712]
MRTVRVLLLVLLCFLGAHCAEDVTSFGDGLSVASAGSVAMFVLKATSSDGEIASAAVRASGSWCLETCTPWSLPHVLSDVGEGEASIEYMAPTRSGMYTLVVLVRVQNRTDLSSTESEVLMTLQVLPQQAVWHTTKLMLSSQTTGTRCPKGFYLVSERCLPCIEASLCQGTGYQVTAGSVPVLVSFADPYGNPAMRSEVTVEGLVLLANGFERLLGNEALSLQEGPNISVSRVHLNVQQSGNLTVSVLLLSQHVAGSPFTVEVVPGEVDSETSLLSVQQAYMTAGRELEVALQMLDTFENPVSDRQVVNTCSFRLYLVLSPPAALLPSPSSSDSSSSSSSCQTFVVPSQDSAALRLCGYQGPAGGGCLFSCSCDRVGDVNISAVLSFPDGRQEAIKNSLTLQVRPGLPNALATSITGAALSLATCGAVSVFSVYPRDMFGNLRQEEASPAATQLLPDSSCRSSADVLFSSRGGEHVGSFNVTCSGSYLLAVKLGGFLLIQQKEFLVRILPSSVCSSSSFAQGTGLTLATAGLEANFAVHLRDQFGNVAYTPTENCSSLTFRLSPDVLVELPLDNAGLGGEEEQEDNVRTVGYTSFIAGGYNVSLLYCLLPLRSTEGLAAAVKEQRVDREVTTATAGQVYTFTGHLLATYRVKAAR